MQLEINFVAFVFIRCLSAFIFLPLHGLLKSAAIKLALALFCSALLLEQLEPRAIIIQPALIFTEIALGIAIGFPLVFLVELAKMWGALFSTASGQNNAEIADPGVVSFSPALGVLLKNALWVCLVVGGAIPLILSGLHNSFQQVPPGALEFSKAVTIFHNLLTILICSLSNTLLYFTPLALLFCALDLSLGVLGRIFPRFNLSSEIVGVKSVVGYGLLLVAINSGLIMEISKEGLALYASISRRILE